eukprot:12356756-Alexandrium_andersonii.AAC.1
MDHSGEEHHRPGGPGFPGRVFSWATATSPSRWPHRPSRAWLSCGTGRCPGHTSTEADARLVCSMPQGHLSHP